MRGAHRGGAADRGGGHGGLGVGASHQRGGEGDGGRLHDPCGGAEGVLRGAGGILRSLAFEKYEVLYNRVGALLISIDGVVDYTDLTLNGKAASVAVGPEEIPALGEVTLT